MKQGWLAFGIFLFFHQIGLAYRDVDTDVSILAECQWNKELLTPQAECNDLFHHYPPLGTTAERIQGQVRLGSFNIYKMGYSETKYKDLDLIADLIDGRWDVVALSELQHNMADDLAFNARAVEAFRRGLPKGIAQSGYKMPEYLRLLLKLQQRDISWGLFISPVAQSSTNELYGFFYRQAVATPIPSAYCRHYLDQLARQPLLVHGELSTTAETGLQRFAPPLQRAFVKPTGGEAIACPLSVEGDFQSQFSKVPFTARFKSGDFDFSYISLHLRFRANGTVKGECADECERLAAEAAKAIGVEPGYISDERQIARFFEAFATLQEAVEINQLTNDNDTIIAGDFNLEYGKEANKKMNEVWDKVLAKLPDAKIYIEEKTSLSKLNGPANNYDHFIFVPKVGSTSECLTNTARAVDFTSPEFEFAPMLAAAQDPANFKVIEEKYAASLVGAHRIVADVAYPMWQLSPSELVDFLAGFPSEEQSEIKSTFTTTTSDKYKDCRDNNKTVNATYAQSFVNDLYCQILLHSASSPAEFAGKKEPYRIYTGFVSDHLPIEMTCQTDQSDDD